MQIYYLILGVLGVWRISHLLTQENGPGNVLEKLRQFAGSGFGGQLMECFYCVSLWVAAPFALLLGPGWKERALLWPALSGAAILLERFSTERQKTGCGFYVPGSYREEAEDKYVLR